jgi:ribosomal protein S18 acetylase RimI-like enzyme
MITVRVAIMEDASAIGCLTVEIQQLHREALPDSTVAVAESNGEIVGYVYGATMHRPENDFKKTEKYMYIQQIGVRKDARRQGVGRALIAFIESRALASAVTGLQLDYWAFNTRAQSFFESCGFSASQITMRRGLSSS